MTSIFRILYFSASSFLRSSGVRILGDEFDLEHVSPLATGPEQRASCSASDEAAVGRRGRSCGCWKENYRPGSTWMSQAFASVGSGGFSSFGGATAARDQAELAVQGHLAVRLEPEPAGAGQGPLVTRARRSSVIAPGPR